MQNDMLNNIIKSYETPIYILDINKVKERIEYLKSRLSSKILLCYAVKANTFIVKDIESEIDRFEVCSLGEYQICKHKEIDDKKILISGVYKTAEMLEEIITNNPGISCFTVESIEQFKLIRNLKSKNKLNLILRLTSGNQFGMMKEEIEQIIRNRINYENISIIGIQYFSGTQKKSINYLKKELEYVDEFLNKINTQYNFEIKEFEFGPGFPVDYFQNSEYDEEKFLKEFLELLNKLKFQGKIILELGRSISASCGNYVTKVVDTKTNKNQNYAIVDGGIHQIVYYGQSMAMKTPKCKIYPERENLNSEKWNICGSLCTVNDILIKQFPINNLQIGDIIIFENAGAYCMTEGISLFLSRDLPQVIKIKDDKNIELIRQNVKIYNLNM